MQSRFRLVAPNVLSGGQVNGFDRRSAFRYDTANRRKGAREQGETRARPFATLTVRAHELTLTAAFQFSAIKAADAISAQSCVTGDRCTRSRVKRQACLAIETADDGRAIAGGGEAIETLEIFSPPVLPTIRHVYGSAAPQVVRARETRGPVRAQRDGHAATVYGCGELQELCPDMKIPDVHRSVPSGASDDWCIRRTREGTDASSPRLAEIFRVKQSAIDATSSASHRAWP